MRKYWALPLVLAVTCFTLSCGSSRHLQSISITQTANGQQIQFVATGNFSSAPITVTPLPVAWGFGPFAPPPPTLTYTLTTQPFSFDCAGSGPYLPVSAAAPSNPNAPLNGTLPFAKIVTGSAPVTCP
jgi:hypothetical protein